MASTGDISQHVDFHELRATLKRVAPESEKAMRKALSRLGTEAKNEIQRSAPVLHGQLRRSLSKKTTFNGSKTRVEVTSKVRYPFIVNYGRTKYRPFAGRHFISGSIMALEPRIEREMDQIKRDALRVFD